MLHNSWSMTLAEALAITAQCVRPRVGAWYPTRIFLIAVLPGAARNPVAKSLFGGGPHR
jgi:hypothetical protein